MNEQQLRSILAKRAARDKRAAKEAAAAKAAKAKHRNAVATMNRIAKGK